MEKVAVFPVPDCAWAMTSEPGKRGQRHEKFGLITHEPLMTGMIARCWIAEGRSKP